MKVFCLDTETSAGSRDGKIVQVAIVDEEFRQEWLINPESYIQPGCIAVHKITPEMVQDKPNFFASGAYKELQKRLDNDEILIAHHAPFDTAILANEGVHIEKYICTCKVARKILKADGVPRFGLQFLKDYLKLEKKIPKIL
ncbi:exonuclease domain-containing protein [Candidatus Gracilibacteria bacterium]|nr:exonuclease domain-containing protein [Candidatus Gracilibacteria bacterium]